MYLELYQIMELIDEKKTKNFLISNISINENVSNFIFASRLFLEPELKRKFSKIKIKINPSKKDISKVKYDFLDSSGNNLIFSTEVNKKKMEVSLQITQM